MFDMYIYIYYVCLLVHDNIYIYHIYLYTKCASILPIQDVSPLEIFVKFSSFCSSRHSTLLATLPGAPGVGGICKLITLGTRGTSQIRGDWLGSSGEGSLPLKNNR